MSLARTLAEAFTHRSTAVSLLLPSSADLRCNNLMCEHVTAGCACRLALSLERMPLLEVVDVRSNGLPVLPDSLFALPRLHTLRAAGNALRALPPSLAACASLTHLDLGSNRLQSLPMEALAALPLLSRLRITGNPLTAQATAALRGHSSLWKAVEAGEAWVE
jgi:Leucine-rich repeat (LRR) protein